MANGVLGLGTGQASTLNSELIDKLKAAERKSTVEPKLE
jgi:flagellar hook-associated protein 2